VRPPRGVGAADACGRGTVTIQVKAPRATVSTRRAPLRADCTFSSRVTFRRLAPRRLSFAIRFNGNIVLTPARTRLPARAG
ncbi:MAG: hypothetical protein M3P50_13885, partial [Actinomycetota bacterium]|nr:hypothetical protein [Actinomycetota bacterium]